MNGALRITARDAGGYTVTWAPQQWGGGALKSREVASEDDLRDFLLGISVHRDQVSGVLRRLAAEGRVTLPEVWLSEQEQVRQQLGPG